MRVQQPVSELKVADELKGELATFVVTGDPSTVRHHFLIIAVPEECGKALAERVKEPVTVRLSALDHSTSGL